MRLIVLFYNSFYNFYSLITIKHDRWKIIEMLYYLLCRHYHYMVYSVLEKLNQRKKKENYDVALERDLWLIWWVQKIGSVSAMYCTVQLTTIDKIQSKKILFKLELMYLGNGIDLFEIHNINNFYSSIIIKTNAGATP